MSNNNWNHSSWSQTPQQKTFTITGVGGNTDVWTFTLTDDDGATYTVTYTNDGSPTTTEIGVGLAAAWEASTSPFMQRITASNPSAGVVKLTADNAGIPFSVALTNGGTGTSSSADTVANVGNYDAGLTRNWSLNAVPIATNDLIFEAGTVSLLYGLNLSGVALADFRVMTGCQSSFGRFEYGKYFYFRIAPTLFDYRGSGKLSMFDIGSAAIAPYIESYGTPEAQGRNAIYIKGSAMTTLEVAKGNVGVAVLDADTATVATILCGSLTTPQSDVNMTVGSGVTLTTLTMTGGVCLLKCAATTLNVYPGCVLTTEGTGAYTTVNVYAGGKFYPKSSGTITTLNLWGEADFTRDSSARTVSTLNLKRGGKLTKTDNITVTATALPSSSGGGVDIITAA